MSPNSSFRNYFCNDENIHNEESVYKHSVCGSDTTWCFRNNSTNIWRPGENTNVPPRICGKITNSVARRKSACNRPVLVYGEKSIFGRAGQKIVDWIKSQQLIQCNQLILFGWIIRINSIDLLISDDSIDSDKSGDLTELYKLKSIQLIHSNELIHISCISWIQETDSVYPNNWSVSIDTQFDEIHCFERHPKINNES